LRGKRRGDRCKVRDGGIHGYTGSTVSREKFKYTHEWISMEDKDEWDRSIIESKEGKEEEDKSYAQLCREVADLVFDIMFEVYEEEEYVNCLSVTDEEKYKKRSECLDFVYGIGEIAEKLVPKVKALCRKIYRGTSNSK
jgi:ethanolamine utilization protein EutA (predicted chaperonin)